MCLAGSHKGLLLLWHRELSPMQGVGSSVAEAQGQHLSKISGV